MNNNFNLRNNAVHFAENPNTGVNATVFRANYLTNMFGVSNVNGPNSTNNFAQNDLIALNSNIQSTSETNTKNGDNDAV